MENEKFSPKDQLTKDDLFFLMEGYKNAIELSTSLLSSQNEIINILKVILDNQSICKVERQKKSEKEIDVIYQINDQKIVRLEVISKKLDDACKEIIHRIKEEEDSTIDKIVNFEKTYNNSSGRLYMISGSIIIGLIGVVGSLITFGYHIMNKYDHILEIVLKIAKANGITY